MNAHSAPRGLPAQLFNLKIIPGKTPGELDSRYFYD